MDDLTPAMSDAVRIAAAAMSRVATASGYRLREQRFSLARTAVDAAYPLVAAEVREQVMRELMATSITQSTPVAEYRKQVEAAALRNAADVLWQRAEKERAEYRNSGQSIEYINGIEVASEALDQLADGLDGGASSE